MRIRGKSRPSRFPALSAGCTRFALWLVHLVVLCDWLVNNLRGALIGPFISLLSPLSWLSVAGVSKMSPATRDDVLTTPLLFVVISANIAVCLFCLQPFTPTNQSVMGFPHGHLKKFTWKHLMCFLA